MHACLALLLCLSLTAAVEGAQPVARGVHVDPVAGNDAHDGVTRPVKTIARAVRLAAAGDTIHLAPGRYQQSAEFINQRGEPGRPITLDGHGAVLDGADPLRAADWEQVGAGLYRNDRLIRMSPSILMRWFFVFDGRMNRMGRTSKGPSAPLKKPGELAPGEWTYVPDTPDAPQNRDGARRDAATGGAFFIKIEPAKSLADYRIEAPLRANGVAFGGRGAHLAVRNVTATHFHNDGFNVHGDQRDLQFSNIAAIDCGDDGFSAHETAECRIEGFVSRGNSTGLCDIGASRTQYRNVFIGGCIGHDVFFTSHGEHRIENALIHSSAVRAVSAGRDAEAEGECTVRLSNVHVRRVGGGPQELRISRGGRLEAERCTLENLAVQAAPGSATFFRRCVVRGEPKPEVVIAKDATWRGEGNRYGVKNLRVGPSSFLPQAFASFQQAVGGESGSQAGQGETLPAGVGAEETALRQLIPAGVE